MHPFDNKAELIQTEEWKHSYRQSIRQQAIDNGSFLAYYDEQNRLVREYPGTGEIYQVSPDNETLTLLSINGQVVPEGEKTVKPITDIAELNKALETAF